MKPRWMPATRRLVTVAVARLVRFLSSFFPMPRRYGLCLSVDALEAFERESLAFPGGYKKTVYVSEVCTLVERFTEGDADSILAIETLRKGILRIWIPNPGVKNVLVSVLGSEGNRLERDCELAMVAEFDAYGLLPAWIRIEKPTHACGNMSPILLIESKRIPYSEDQPGRAYDTSDHRNGKGDSVSSGGGIANRHLGFQTNV